MAGPVKWFRKNKKKSLAILTILTVLSFVFVPILIQILELSRGGRDPVVVTTAKYGRLGRSELASIEDRRGRLSGFLQALQREVSARGGAQFLRVAQNGYLLIPIGGQLYPVPAENGLYLFVDGAAEHLASLDEQGAVATWLARNKAREMGIATSQETANHWLAFWSQGKIDSNSLAKLAGNFRLSPSQLFDALGNELSAIRVRRILRTSLVSMPMEMTPAQRWDYFLRLKRSARIEAVPIDIGKLVAEVPDPTAADEKELKALFEKYKEKRPNPSSAEPGFRELHQIVVQYFKADLKTFLDLREVSDEEIQKFYDAHKEDRYTHLAPPDFVKVPPATEKPKAEGPKPKTESPKPKSEISNPKSEISNPKSEISNPKSQISNPKEESKPKVEGPKPKTETPKPKAEGPKPKSDTPQDPAKEPAAPEESDPKTSAIESRRPVPLMLVSSRKEEEKKPEPAKPKADAAAPGTPGLAPSTGTAEPKSEISKPKSEISNPKSEISNPKSQISNPKPETAKPKSEISNPKSPVPPPKAEPPKPKLVVTPLSEVKEKIREELAKDKAKEKMLKALDAVQKAMTDFDQDHWMPYDQLPEKEKKTQTPPEPPDLTSIAKANRLGIPYCTGWISELDVPEWDIGKSRVEGGTPFVDRAFGQVPLYQSMISQDDDGNQYLFWKLDDYPERIPEWDDPGVSDRVVHAWKLDKARKLARDEADRIVAESRQSKKPLGDVVAAMGGAGASPARSSAAKMPARAAVLTPAPFTWLVDRSRGGIFGGSAPTFGEVKGPDGKPIPYLHGRFMQRVFAIPPGGTDWAENDPETMVYVVRVIEHSPLENTLWEDFLVTSPETYEMAAEYDQAAAAQAWTKEFETDAGLEWRREPARGRAEAAPEADFD